MFDTASLKSGPAAAAESPEAETRRNPSREIRAQLIRAWRNMLQARCKEALSVAESILPRLASLDRVSAERSRSEIAFLRAVGNAMSDDPHGVLAVLTEPAATARHHRLGHLLLRFSYCRMSQWPDFYELPVEINTESRCDIVVRLFELTVFAAAALEKLQLITASRFATDALVLARDHGLEDSIAAASAAVVLGAVRYELGYLDQAEELVVGRMSTIRALGMPDVIIGAYWLLSRIAQHRAQHDHATLLLSDGQRVGETRACPRIVLTMMYEKVRMLMGRGEVHAARQIATEMRRFANEHSAPLLVREELEQLSVLASARANAGWSAAEAMKSLEQMLQNAQSSNRLRKSFQLALELSEAMCARGRDEAAEQLVLQLLDTSERAGLLQSWVDAGSTCGALLSRMAKESQKTGVAVLRPYLDSLLNHRSANQNIQKRSRPSSVRAFDQLSSRERVVLALIARGQSNKRVAKVLSVAPETIKSHVKHAFAKLGAKTRAEAVLRATDLGQLVGVVVPMLDSCEHTYA
jgi:LuxR family maltose regulon positive regulatory protein